MSVEITRAGSNDAEEWNRCVERSAGASSFHRYEALLVQAVHSGTRLHPLIGHKGQEPIGLLPLFEMQKGPFTGVFSPPPYLWVPALGPALLNMDKLKQRKRERRHERFIEGCLDWLNREVDPHYARIRTEQRYNDVRPFMWNGWSAAPEYTYVVDLTPGPDELLTRFSRGVRNDIRGVENESYTVEVGNVEAARQIITRVKRRYETQNEPYEATPGFVADLMECLPDSHIHPYVLRVDGEFVTGMVVIESGDTAYRWQGGTKHGADIPANDLLDWHIMHDAIKRGRESFDLVGAGNRRINQYKTKFNPELRPFYTLESGSMKLFADFYTKLCSTWP